MSDFSVRFWGTRGSIPVFGPQVCEFGGNTICIEIALGGQSFIVDCGSGALGLGQAILAEGQRSASMLLTHFHLDHVIGLAGFAPLFDPSFALSLRAPHQPGIGLEQSLKLLFEEPLSPIGFATLPAALDIAGFQAGEDVTLGAAVVRTVALRHGQATSGYRFDHSGRAFVVLTDHEHAGDDPDPALVRFCAGADAIAYDAMWCADSDYRCHRGWGHSTWQAGLALMRAAGARRVVCLHHSPTADDALLRSRSEQLAAQAPGSFFARDGDTLVL